MSNMLFEYRDYQSAKLLMERDETTKDVLMSGILVQAETRNHNGRVYPLREISAQVEALRRRIQSDGGVGGELDHPPELTINLDRVSHLIVDMWMNGNDGCGKLRLLGTPCGLIAKSLLEGGMRLGVSSRGSGNVDNSGYVSDFEMITVDIVAQPSAPNAYPKQIYESLYNMKGGAAIFDVAKSASYKDPRAQHHLTKEITKFISELNKK